MLTAFIAIGTFTAFDAAGKSSADERAHAQGTLLAQQDQERLRSFTTTTLEQMGTVETYRAENGMCLEKSGSTYTYFNGSKNTLFCEKVTGFAGTTYKGTALHGHLGRRLRGGRKRQRKSRPDVRKNRRGPSANYIQTKSSVAWPLLGKRPAVSQTSVLNVPSSYVLLVKVLNQNNEALEGATVSVTGGPSAVTPAAGCVTFGGLSSETVEVSATKGNWIDYTGKTPTSETRSETVYQPGGRSRTTPRRTRLDRRRIRKQRRGNRDRSVVLLCTRDQNSHAVGLRRLLRPRPNPNSR